ncbi:MAG: ABC transporter permease [Thermoleophilia bacterium]
MLRATLKGILAQKLRLVLTGLAIVIGVGFISGTYIFGDTLNKAFDNLFAGIYAKTDVVVQGVGFVSDQDRPSFSQDLLAQLRRVDGVRDASGGVEGTAQLIKPNGKAVSTGGGPAQGFSWDGGETNNLTIDEGSPPTAPGDIVLEQGVADANDFAVGQSVKAVVPTGTQTFRIVGIASLPGDQSLGSSSTVFFSLEEAQRIFQKEGQLDSISVAADPGVSESELRDRIAPVLPVGVEAQTAQSVQRQQSQDIKDQLSFLTTFLLVFGYIAVFVAAFIIFNTFSITVAQRARQLALLRAVGATGGQVTRMVVLEAFVVGVIASILGLALGFLIALGVKGLFSLFGADLPSTGMQLTSRTIVVGLLVGVIVTLVAALLPALRAARLPPVAALREEVAIPTGSRRRRLVIGGVVTVVGAVLIAVALQGDTAQQVFTLLGVGVLVIFIGLAMLAPLIARPLASILGRPGQALAGVPGKLGRENAMRNPQRTAQTATALMIGLALVTFVSVFAASISTSVGRAIDRQFKADLVMYDESSFQGFPLAAAEAVRGVPGVESVAEVRTAQVRVDGDEHSVSGVDPATIASAYDPEFTSGGWADLGAGRILVQKDTAKEDHLSVGGTVTMQFSDGTSEDLRVAGLYKSGDVGAFAISMQDYDAHVPQQLDIIMFANGRSGVDATTLHDDVDAALADYPSLTVRNQAEYKQFVEDSVNSFLALIYALLALAIIIAIFGIVNTLALSIFERTREIGLLRAVGLSARQSKRMVRWESVIVALLGGLLGVVLGIIFGVVAASATPDLDAITIPWVRIVIFFVLAGLAGVLAAIWPARRAAKLNVLRAIQQE